MLCQKCGLENDDDAKHCKECGAKLSNEQVQEKEKSSFINEHKKLVLGVGGILAIFVIFALISIGIDQTVVNSDLTEGIEKDLQDNGYNVSRSVKEGHVRLSATNLNLADNQSEGDLVDVYLFPMDMLNEVSADYDLSPRKINGMNGYGGYSQKVYNYAYKDNGDTIVIMTSDENSPILDTIVKDY